MNATTKKALIVLGVLGFFGLLFYLTLGNRQNRVNVCMQFQGHTSCRIASGATRELALRTATQNACATISAGATDSMACESSRPVSLKWLD